MSTTVIENCIKVDTSKEIHFTFLIINFAKPLQQGCNRNKISKGIHLEYP